MIPIIKIALHIMQFQTDFSRIVYQLNCHHVQYVNYYPDRSHDTWKLLATTELKQVIWLIELMELRWRIVFLIG